jgi:hypothetical protein
MPLELNPFVASVKSSLKYRKDEWGFEMIFIKKDAGRYDIGQVFF